MRRSGSSWTICTGRDGTEKFDEYPAPRPPREWSREFADPGCDFGAIELDIGHEGLRDWPPVSYFES
jgi:hypothetical protein